MIIKGILTGIVFLVICIASQGDTSSVYMYPQFQLQYDDKTFTHSDNSTSLSVPDHVDLLPIKDNYVSTVSINAGYIDNVSGKTFIPGIAIREDASEENVFEYSREYYQAGNFVFTVILFFEESCGKRGHESRFKYSAYFEKVYDKMVYLTISSDTDWTSSDDKDEARLSLLKLLDAASGLEYLEGNDLDKFYSDNTSSRQFERMTAVIMKDADDLRTQLRITPTHLRPYIYEIKSSHFDPAYLSSHIFKSTIDSIVRIRVDLAQQYIRYLRSSREASRYSLKYERDLYERLEHGSFTHSDYLNYIYKTENAWSGLDTLQKFSLLNRTSEDHIRHILTEDYEPADGNTPSPWNPEILEERFTVSYDNLFAETFYKTILHSSNNQFPYAVVNQQPRSVHYFFFNPELALASQVILASFDKAGNSRWNYTLDTLEERIKFKGNDRVHLFNQYFLLEQRDAVYLVDTSVSPAKCIELEFLPDTLQHYLFNCRDVVFNQDNEYVTPVRSDFQRNLAEASVMNTLWNKVLRNDAFVLYAPAEQRNAYIDLNKGDTLVSRDVYYKYARSVLSPSQMIYRVSYRISDLNNDGKDELYTYSISNGEVVTIHCMSSGTNGILNIDKAVAIAWLNNNPDFRNLLLYSRIGRLTEPH